MIAVDANVITYLILNGEFSEHCSSLFQKDSHWIAPRLWRHEVANVLVRYERSGLLERTVALRAFAFALQIFDKNEFEIGIERVLTVAQRTGCSSYDSEYIALAEDLAVPLYTFDKKILSMAPEIARAPTLTSP